MKSKILVLFLKSYPRIISLQRVRRISSLALLYLFPFNSIVVLHVPTVGDSLDVCAIVTFLLDGWAGICRFLKVPSLIKLLELQESIKAVMSTV